MPPMTVLYNFTVGNLDIFDNLDLVVDNGEDFKAGRETYSEKKSTRVH